MLSRNIKMAPYLLGDISGDYFQPMLIHAHKYTLHVKVHFDLSHIWDHPFNPIRCGLFEILSPGISAVGP